MNPEIQQLKDRITKLEAIITGREVPVAFAEKVRDIVFFDQDFKTTTTRVATDSGGDTVTVIKNPTKWIKTYFRSQVGFVPFYINP